MQTSFKHLAYTGALCATFLFGNFAHAADPIEGKWKTASGETAQISTCGGSFCTKLTTGKFAGRSIGKMKKSGNSYVGTLTDPSNDKTYSGTARLSGATMSLKGCALKIFCKTQKWKKL